MDGKTEALNKLNMSWKQHSASLVFNLNPRLSHLTKGACHALTEKDNQTDLNVTKPSNTAS